MNSHAIEAKYPFKRTTQVQLRFNDIDALGHVNNSVYFQFFDLAKTEYFAGLEVNADINWCKPAIVIANVNCSFLVPTVFQEPVEVLTQCAHLGNKSLTLLQYLINRDTRELKATCATVMVNLDPETNQPAPLPQVWRDAIVAYEGHE